MVLPIRPSRAICAIADVLTIDAADCIYIYWHQNNLVNLLCTLNLCCIFGQSSCRHTQSFSAMQQGQHGPGGKDKGHAVGRAVKGSCLPGGSWSWSQQWTDRCSDPP